MKVAEGFITTPDGVRLSFQKVGSGDRTVIVPNAIYMIEDFKYLAKDRTMIFFDLRNRGRSDAVIDIAKLKGGIHNDVEDIEAVRRHFGLTTIDLIGHSYVGAVVALYAMKYPEHVNRVVQIGPVQPSMAKQYPASLTNTDDTMRDVFTKLAQMQSEQSTKDPVDACKQVWSVLRLMYVFDPKDAHKLAHWDFCELS
ncbi:MAG TPA: alpha/beta hydrolase, partial [Steroidobacteraceae bacterium]|nr:alpha/beta hydrolase [Steroidobacteraceae bacterium]